MRARKLVGKRIKAVRQERFWNEHLGEWAVALHAIEFDDGSVLLLDTAEQEDGCYVEGRLYRNGEPL